MVVESYGIIVLDNSIGCFVPDACQYSRGIALPRKLAGAGALPWLRHRAFDPSCVTF